MSDQTPEDAYYNQFMDEPMTQDSNVNPPEINWENARTWPEEKAR